MISLFKKYKVTILSEKWEIVKENFKVSVIPRADELIYIPKEEKYFKVSNVVYTLNDKQDIFIVIEPYTDKIDIKQ